MISRSWTPTAMRSSLAGSLRSLGERFKDRPVAGVVLFTDGNLTDAPPADFDWSTIGFPVYPVLPAEDDQFRRSADQRRQRSSNRF